MLNGDGSTRTITIPDRSKYAGVRTIDKNDGSTLTVNRAAPVVTSDRAGESRPLLSKLVGGAAAAYSLRDLNDKAGNSKVVRVRRASDNHEKDFRAKEVKDIAAWVNTQTTLPLDIQELEADGRTGDVVEATAAYSLRNLSSSYTGNVVDVRRSSDDAEESFTAAEVADGTLTDWVNTNFNVKTYDFSSNAGGLVFPSNLTLDGGQSIAGVDDALKMSVVSNGSTTVHRCYQHITPLGKGSGLRITFKAYRPSSNVDSGKLGFSLADGFLDANIAAQFFSEDDTWEDFTFETGSSSSSRFYLQLSSTNGGGSTKSIFNGTTGDHVYIKNLKIDVVNSSGHVSKWYDQSGNDNHATQGTEASQPKIVDGGTLVSGGMRFDDNQFLQTTNTFTYGSGTTLSTFLVNSSDGDENAYLFRFAANYIVWNAIDGTRKVSAGANANAGKVTGDEELWTTISELNTAGGTSNFYVDGTLAAAADAPIGTNVVSPARKLNIGGSGVTSHWNGTVNEIIFYDSDQSDNRTAIEANIVDHYGIDLPSGVDTGYDQVDGFVETWYDQSGNGNDAIQTVAANQPKIVDAGVFLGQVDFLNGVSTFLETNNSDLANLSELSLFGVLEPVTSGANEFPISAGSIVNSTGNYGGWALWANGYREGLDFTTQARGSGTNTAAQLDITSTIPVVYSATLNGTDAQASLNGVLGVENTSMITPNNTDATRRKLRLGCQYTFAPASFYRGAIKEIILYTSDQSANREAIEANINNQYSIY